MTVVAFVIKLFIFHVQPTMFVVSESAVPACLEDGYYCWPHQDGCSFALNTNGLILALR